MRIELVAQAWSAGLRPACLASSTVSRRAGGRRSNAAVTSRFHGKKTQTTINAAVMTTRQRHLMTKSITGWYSQMRKRLMGFFSSFGILPRMNQPIRIGASVMDSSAAAAIE